MPSASDLARIGEILLKGILRLPPPAEPQEERVQPKPSRLPSREIDPLDNRILQSLAFFGDTSPGFLCEQTGASSATLRRRLRTLEEIGLIEREGNTRAARYRATSRGKMVAAEIGGPS